jgi:hypothetical protein
LKGFEIPENVELISASAFMSLKMVSVSTSNRRFSVQDAILYDNEKHWLVRNFNKSNIIEIGADIELLGEWCFANCPTVEEVTFSRSSVLTRILSRAFSESSLRSISLPSRLQHIDDYCFFYCLALQSVVFAPSSELARVGPFAFSGCGLKEITLPRMLACTDPSCFAKCPQLEYPGISEGSTLRVIGDGHFAVRHWNTFRFLHLLKSSRVRDLHDALNSTVLRWHHMAVSV